MNGDSYDLCIECNDGFKYDEDMDPGHFCICETGSICENEHNVPFICDDDTYYNWWSDSCLSEDECMEKDL